MNREDASFIYDEIEARILEDMPREEILDIMCYWVF
jgi:hypothetical protein